MEDYTGVEFNIHWLTVSFRGEPGQHFEYLVDKLGPSEYSDRGGYGYTQSNRYLSGAVYYSSPDLLHSTLVIPGDACEVLTAEVLREIARGAVDSGGKCTRIDIAFDHLAFEPCEVWDVKDDIVSKANRDTFRYTQSIDHLCDTVTIGSRSSERFMRIYNKRGFTRVELECKKLQAEFVVSTWLDAESSDLSVDARRLIAAYVMIDAPFWGFFSSVEPLLHKVRAQAEIVRGRLLRWLSTQVAAALAAVNRTSDDRENIVLTLLEIGQNKPSFYRYLAAMT